MHSGQVDDDTLRDCFSTSDGFDEWTERVRLGSIFLSSLELATRRLGLNDMQFFLRLNLGKTTNDSCNFEK